jgi:hypothetical protein
MKKAKRIYKIPHFEIIGNGRPSATLGLPGDVYIDADNPQFSLYWKGKVEWKPWPGAERITSVLGDKATRAPFDHPFLPGKYLWVLGTKIAWLEPNKI